MHLLAELFLGVLLLSIVRSCCVYRCLHSRAAQSTLLLIRVRWLMLDCHSGMNACPAFGQMYILSGLYILCGADWYLGHTPVLVCVTCMSVAFAHAGRRVIMSTWHSRAQYGLIRPSGTSSNNGSGFAHVQLSLLWHAMKWTS